MHKKVSLPLPPNVPTASLPLQICVGKEMLRNCNYIQIIQIFDKKLLSYYFYFYLYGLELSILSYQDISNNLYNSVLDKTF